MEIYVRGPGEDEDESYVLICATTDQPDAVVAEGTMTCNCDVCGTELYIAPSGQELRRMKPKTMVVCGLCSTIQVGEAERSGDKPSFNVLPEALSEVAGALGARKFLFMMGIIFERARRPHAQVRLANQEKFADLLGTSVGVCGFCGEPCRVPEDVIFISETYAGEMHPFLACPGCAEERREELAAMVQERVDMADRVVDDDPEGGD